MPRVSDVYRIIYMGIKNKLIKCPWFLLLLGLYYQTFMRSYKTVRNIILYTIVLKYHIIFTTVSDIECILEFA